MKNLKNFKLYTENDEYVENISSSINIAEEFVEYNIKSLTNLDYQVFAWYNAHEFNFSYITADKKRSLFTVAKYTNYNDGELLTELGETYERIDNNAFHTIMDALTIFMDKKDFGHDKMFITQRVAKLLEPIVSKDKKS